MPRTPQKPAIPANAADQAAQTVPEHTTLHPADHESGLRGARHTTRANRKAPRGVRASSRNDHQPVMRRASLAEWITPTPLSMLDSGPAFQAWIR